MLDLVVRARDHLCKSVAQDKCVGILTLINAMGIQ